MSGPTTPPSLASPTTLSSTLRHACTKPGCRCQPSTTEAQGMGATSVTSATLLEAGEPSPCCARRSGPGLRLLLHPCQSLASRSCWPPPSPRSTPSCLRRGRVCRVEGVVVAPSSEPPLCLALPRLGLPRRLGLGRRHCTTPYLGWGYSAAAPRPCLPPAEAHG